MVKRSLAYRAIRSRVADPCPSDAWSEDGLAFVVFDLHPANEFRRAEGAKIPQAVFALSTASGELIAARVVEPGSLGGEPAVSDLLQR